MKEVKAIELVFENCETMLIKKHLIGCFRIRDIHQSICRTACNYIGAYDVAGSVVIELKNDVAEKEHIPFGIEDYKTTMMKRLLHCDITYVDIIYDDDSRHEYAVNYEDDGDGSLGAPNANQKVKVGDNGNLYIVIEEGKDISDYFTDKEMSASHWHVIDTEEFEWEKEGFPKAFRYFYAENGDKSDIALNIATDLDDTGMPNVVVYDEDKKMIQPIDFIIKEWSYPSEGTDQYLCEKYSDTPFSIKAIAGMCRGSDKERAEAIKRFEDMTEASRKEFEDIAKDIEEYNAETAIQDAKEFVRDAAHQAVEKARSIAESAEKKIAEAEIPTKEEVKEKAEEIIRRNKDKIEASRKVLKKKGSDIIFNKKNAERVTNVLSSARVAIDGMEKNLSKLMEEKKDAGKEEEKKE